MNGKETPIYPIKAFRNANKLLFDKSSELREQVLSKMGYEYGLMYHTLQKNLIDVLKWDDDNIKESKPCKWSQGFLICDAYKIDYEAGGKQYRMTIFVNSNNGRGFASWGLGPGVIPQMGLFGGIK